MTTKKTTKKTTRKPTPKNVPRILFVEVHKGMPNGVTKLEEEALDWAIGVNSDPIYVYRLVERFRDYRPGSEPGFRDRKPKGK